MDTEILKGTEIQRAIDLLKEGGNVIFPTETVYGLGARIDDNKAVEGIFIAKQRPQDNPLIVHIGSREQVKRLACSVSENAERLMDAFWPGPLTIALKKTAFVSDQVTAGLKTVGIRMPSHPVARKLLCESGLFIAAPSANPSGYPSPTRAKHTLEMKGRVSAILLGDDSEVGLESTFIDMSVEPPRILRQGVISVEEIEKIIGEVEIYQGNEKTASPGRRYKHYAPRTKVCWLKGTVEQKIQFIQEREESLFLVGDSIAREVQKKNVIRWMPEGNIYEASKNYYALLREHDDQYEAIYIEDFEDQGVARALYDRVQRSTQGKIKQLEGK